jgi:hypothetical protein
MTTLKSEFDDLWDLKIKIESKNFQERLVKPLYEEMESLGKAYDQNSLRELATLKGRRQGLKFFIELLKQVDIDIKNKKFELESQQD